MTDHDQVSEWYASQATGMLGRPDGEQVAQVYATLAVAAAVQELADVLRPSPTAGEDRSE